MFTIAAAHSVGKRTASPLTTGQFAASVSIRTLALTIGADNVLVLGWSLLHKWNDVILLSACTRRNIARVALRTAVFTIAAAHSVGKRTASPLTTGQFAASVSIRTLALTIGADNVLVLGWSLLHKWNDVILLSACTRRNIARVALRTAVFTIAAAHSVGKRTASPLTTGQFAASVSVRTLGLIVRADNALVLGWSLLHKWNDFTLLSACTRRNIARVALRTAVFTIAAAHSVGKGAASPLTSGQFAASVSIRTFALTIGADNVLVLGWSLLHKWNDVILPSACTRRNIARVAVRTAVEMVTAAHSVGNRAASPLTTGQFAASVSIRTLALTIGADNVLVLGWSLLHKWNDVILPIACTHRNIARVAVRTAVDMVIAAHSVGIRAACPLTTGQLAASVSIRTFALTIGADNVLVLGWSLLHKWNDVILPSACTRRNIARVAVRTAVEMVTAAHSVGNRAASPLTTGQFAASVSIRTLALTIGADNVLVLGWSLLHKWNDVILPIACTHRNIARVAVRTAVDMVIAAHSVGIRAACPLTTGQLAASVSIRTLALTIGADNALELLMLLQN